jgi:hypothetical protein
MKFPRTMVGIGVLVAGTAVLARPAMPQSLQGLEKVDTQQAPPGLKAGITL